MAFVAALKINNFRHCSQQILGHSFKYIPQSKYGCANIYVVSDSVLRNTHKLNSDYNRNFSNYRIKFSILCLRNSSLWLGMKWLFVNKANQLTFPHWIFFSSTKRTNKFSWEQSHFSAHYTLNNDVPTQTILRSGVFLLKCDCAIKISCFQAESIFADYYAKFPQISVRKTQCIKTPVTQIDYFSIFRKTNKSCAAYQLHFIPLWLEVCTLVKNTDFNKLSRKKDNTHDATVWNFVCAERAERSCTRDASLARMKNAHAINSH